MDNELHVPMGGQEVLDIKLKIMAITDCLDMRFISKYFLFSC